MEGTLPTHELLDARRFEILVRRLADSLSYGTDRSAFLGGGIEYVQSRPYEPGDPVRSIDWRITARTGRYHVKEHEAPKRMPVYLVLDTSASMTVASTRLTKYGTALHLAGGIALACLERVSPVGVLGAGQRAVRIEPSLSKAQVLEWILRLRRFRYDETTLLARRLSELAPRLANRALLIVLSDLHDPGSLEALKQLSQRHECAVIELADPAEDGLRGAGLMRAREAETGRAFWTHGRRRHADPERTARELRRAGIDHLRLVTDRPYVDPVRHFLRERGLLSRTVR
jgi:uncharacterized protein (DUF58 family)